MTKHHHHQHDHGHDDAMIELLDLDAVVLREPLAQLLDLLGERLGDAKRVLDLGSGPGSGTFALLERFGGAEAVALDLSADYLKLLRHRAAERGLDGRVTTREADLDAGWPDGLGAFDLAWAAGSMHHLADPDRVLRDLRAALTPGGLFALVEMDGFPRFLPDDLGFGRAGLEDRLHAARAARHAEEMPNLGDDWGPRLASAGFTGIDERIFGLDLHGPLSDVVRRYARVTLGRFRDGFADRLDPEDLAQLDTLLDDASPHGLARRDDLHLRAERRVWIAAA